MDRLDRRPLAFWLTLLAIAAALPRIILVLFRPPEADAVLTTLADASDYDHLARKLLSGQGFVSPTGEPTAFRPPTYPIYLAGVYAVFGLGNLKAVALIQALLGAGHAVMLALMVLAAGLPKRAALLAGAVAAIYPAFVFQSSQMLTEVLHRFLQTGFLLCLVMATKRGCSRWLIAAGVLFSVAGLNKSTLFAAGPFVVAWLVAVRWNASGRKRALRDVLIFGGAAGIVLGAWTLRNATVSGRFIPVSSNFPITFSQGVTKHSWYTARWNDESELMAAPDDFLALTQLRSYRGVSEELAVGEEWAADARQFIGEKPGWFAALTFRKALHFWSPLIRNSLPARIVALVTMGPVLLLGWIWLFRHIRAAGPERRLAYLALAIAIPVTLPHAISQPDVRYRLALVDPLWIVLGAALVDEFLRTHERHSEQAEGSS